MHSIAAKLVRRGFEAHQNAEYEMPVWGIAILAITTVFFVIANFSIEYTFGRLIPTLVMVESPQETSVESAQPLLDEKATLVSKDSKDLDAVPVKRTPFTSSFLSIIRHLRSEAGCLARYRGFAAFLAYAASVSIASSALVAIRVTPHALGPIIATVLCANFSTTWVHIAISKPSPKYWFQRLPGCKSWRKITGPAFFFALAKQMTCMVPMYLANYWGLLDMAPHEMNALSPEDRATFAWKGLGVCVVGLLMSMLFLLPAKVTMTRVQASLLPEDVDTIVPFDKTFGGRVVPEAIGGTGVVAAREAWRSFDEASKLTLFKTYAKFLAMETTLLAGFAVTIAMELVFILGDDIRRFIPAEGQAVFGSQ